MARIVVIVVYIFSRVPLVTRATKGEESESGGEPFVCDICGKTLKHQKSLYSHRRTHTDAKAVCHICGATLKSSRYLHHHLLLHKDVEKPHKCDKCGKAFFSSSALKGVTITNFLSNLANFKLKRGNNYCRSSPLLQS